MHSDHFGSIWINGIVQFLLGEALSWQYKAAVVDTHFESRLYASWVVPPCSLQFFFAYLFDWSSMSLLCFSQSGGSTTLQKKTYKRLTRKKPQAVTTISNPVPEIIHHRQPPIGSKAPRPNVPVTCHQLRAVCRCRHGEGRCEEGGSDLADGRPMKTGDFIRKTMGFTLWLCQQLAIEVMAQSK